MIASQAPRPGPRRKASVAQNIGSRISQTSGSNVALVTLSLRWKFHAARQALQPARQRQGQGGGRNGDDDAGEHHRLWHRVSLTAALSRVRRGPGRRRCP
jgi:hypothetical protein